MPPVTTCAERAAQARTFALKGCPFVFVVTALERNGGRRRLAPRGTSCAKSRFFRYLPFPTLALPTPLAHAIPTLPFAHPIPLPPCAPLPLTRVTGWMIRR